MYNTGLRTEITKVMSIFTTNDIENFWSALNRDIIGIYHYVSPKHLHRYTSEFGYVYISVMLTHVPAC